MPSTRSSARTTDKSSPSAEDTATSNGTKRKAETNPSPPSPKKGRKSTEKEQKTIEETMLGDTQDSDMKDNDDSHGQNDANGKPDPTQSDETHEDDSAKETSNGTDAADVDESKIIKPGQSWEGKTKEGEDANDPEKALKDSRGGSGLNALPDDKKVKDDAPQDDTHEQASTAPASQSGAVEESKDRANAMPSNLLEKGIIYFFTRGRVGIEDPENVQDLQRSYFVLRPLSPGAKLTDGAIEDIKNNRLFALPKKVWPKGPQDKFMVFVESAKSSMDDLKKSFFQGSEYETKTVGTRHTPPVTPVAEGVYAITTAGDSNESHLSYMMTIPKDPGEMQKDIGLRSKGSFVMSLKNPEVKGPSYATLPQKAEFPDDMIKEFRGRGWMPAEPKHLDYPNAQILLIGESFDSSHALDPTSKDEKSEQKETPAEELEKLEGEDELRVEHLKGDDTVFEDLHISSKDYPSVPTTW